MSGNRPSRTSLSTSRSTPHQFDVRGLGLKDGELVLDYIDRTVSKVEGDGLVKLGNFGDHETPSQPSGGGLSMKWILGVVNVGFIAGLIAFRKRIFR